MRFIATKVANLSNTNNPKKIACKPDVRYQYQIAMNTIFFKPLNQLWAALVSTMRSNLGEADTMKYNIHSTIYLNQKEIRGE